MHFLFLYRLKSKDIMLGKQTVISEYSLQLLGLNLSLFSSGLFLDRMRDFLLRRNLKIGLQVTILEASISEAKKD